jgi:hypothetical protein
VVIKKYVLQNHFQNTSNFHQLSLNIKQNTHIIHELIKFILQQLTAAYTAGNGVRLTVPRLPRPMMNPIGAGDAVASGTLLQWCEAVPVPILQVPYGISA